MSQTEAIKQIDRVSVRDGLIGLYGSTGLSGLRRLSDIIADPSVIRWMNHSSEWLISYRDSGSDEETASMMDEIGDQSTFYRARDALLAMGVIDRGENNEAIIDPDFTSAVKDLVAELEN